MTFVLEDGTGVESANSYVSLAFARDHFTARGQLATWNGTSVTASVTAVDAATDKLTVDYDYQIGDGPITISGGVVPTGLVAGTEYWVAVVDDAANTIKLASSYANAIAATPVVVDITAVGSGSRALTHPDFVALRAAIVRATDYAESKYADLWIGTKGSAEQGLHFPADGIYDPISGDVIDTVPTALARGIVELALIAKTKTLGDPVGAAVSSESRSGGGISRSVTYAVAGATVRYPAVERWLRGLLRDPVAVRA